jgi:hypothetical protein
LSVATRELFLAPPKPRYTDFPLPVSNLTVRIRSLTELERTQFENSRYGRDGKLIPGRLEDTKARLICLCLVDAAGGQLLKTGDEQAVLQMDSADTGALYDACWDHVGFAVKRNPDDDAKN